MTNYIVDRCYDRYIITMSRENDGGEAEEHVGLLKDVLLSVLDERLQTGSLKNCRISGEEDGFAIDVEAAEGCEEALAATLDTVTGGMLLLAERYPDAVCVES